MYIDREDDDNGNVYSARIKKHRGCRKEDGKGIKVLRLCHRHKAFAVESSEFFSHIKVIECCPCSKSTQPGTTKV